MDELSDRAQVVLGGLRDAMTPRELQGAIAWARIENEIERQRSDGGFRRRGRRAVRYAFGYVRRVWMPVIVLLIFALGVESMMSAEVGGSMQLEMARSYLDSGQYREAYNMLVLHSRRYPTRPAAEARMGMAIDALCGLGLKEQAATDLQRYLELNPESKHAERVDAPCSES